MLASSHHSQDPYAPTHITGSLSQPNSAYDPLYPQSAQVKNEEKIQAAGLETVAPRIKPIIAPEFGSEAEINPKISTNQELQSAIDCESGVIGPGEGKLPLIYIKKSIADTQRFFEVEKGYWKISRCL